MSGPTPEPRPHVPPPPPGSEDCGCCDGTQVETPRAISNRSGLGAITYRIGDYARFRESLHATLASSQLGTRDDADFTISLIDAFACAADVLTFYQERLANESYLRTAVERTSLQELSKLVGYRLRPGVAAEAWLAFALETPPEKPAELASEPGSFVTGMPTRLSLPAGIQVQSIPGPDESPQTFETVEALADARPEWNGMRPWLSRHRGLKQGDKFTYLAGASTGLRRGDLLVFVRESQVSAQTAWDFAVVDAIEVSAGRTKVSWTRPLTSFANPFGLAAPMVAYALRRRAAVFGHNAPSPLLFPPEIRAGFSLLGNDFNMVLSETGSAVDLDGLHPEIAVGGWAVLALGSYSAAGVTALPFLPDRVAVGEHGGGGHTALPAVALASPAPGFSDTLVGAGPAIALFQIKGVTEVSRSDYALSGKVSRLTFHPQSASYDRFKDRVRSTTVFAASERLELAPHPFEDSVKGDRIPIAISLTGLERGRRVIIRGTRVGAQTPFVWQALIDGVAAESAELLVHPPLPNGVELVRTSVVVHANVALASHGETVSELLGAGDAGASFQRFELHGQPLTYRSADNETGARAEITLRVNDVAWQERATLFGALPSEQVYTLETNEQGRLFAAFGDGARGARLRTGVNNVRVTYRKGLGAQGNVASEQLSHLLTRPLGVKSTTNPASATGGTDPERAEDARRNLPTTTRTLGRVVSLLDYEDQARAFSGIAKAEAQVLPLRGGRTVVVTIAAPGGTPLDETSPVWRSLLGALRRSGDPFVPLRLLAGKLQMFELVLRVKTHPAYERKAVITAVESRLRAHYCFEARELGQPVHRSEVIAVAQSTEGVIAVDLTALHPTGAAPSRELRLVATRTHFAAGQAHAAELLLLNPERPIRLEVLP